MSDRAERAQRANGALNGPRPDIDTAKRNLLAAKASETWLSSNSGSGFYGARAQGRRTKKTGQASILYRSVLLESSVPGRRKAQ
eukprot:8839664-Pyramimonas_sp.AAC.1